MNQRIDTHSNLTKEMIFQACSARWNQRCTKRCSCQQFHLGVFLLTAPLQCESSPDNADESHCSQYVLTCYFILLKKKTNLYLLMCTVQVIVKCGVLRMTIDHSPFWVWDSMLDRNKRWTFFHWGGLSSAAFSHLPPSCLKAAVDRVQ